jgi:DNA polymerase-3 subunit alpha
VKFVSLHHHTTFSYKDGVGTPEQHLERTAELGMTAQADTEHGNVSGFVRHEQAALKLGVKPLFGCELYTSGPTPTQRKWHLTALAENEKGYQNLNHMVSRSWDPDNFYYWPTTNGSLLKEHAEGLVVLSGCADSLLSCTWLGGKGVEPHAPDAKAAERVALNFKELFGDAYYIEMQMFPELERTRTLNALNATMAERLGIPIVATADVQDGTRVPSQRRSRSGSTTSA